jgi:DNA-binding NarL/FixJ family response regulator
MLAEVERRRLADAREQGSAWWRWGPYVSERQWGTVREDYSAGGTAWDSFPHDHARSRAYRWGEDGLLGISDNHGRLCFALAAWNEHDAILKERLFGLTGPEGNHGEDVKEYYFYLDSTPTHSWMRALYKYPQRAFPYAELVDENRRRGKDQPEYELLDTGIFAEDRYFDIEVAYAKASPTDVVMRISATNRGPETAPLHILPTLWFRNTWTWQRDDPDPGGLRCTERPELRQVGPGLIEVSHATPGDVLHLPNGDVRKLTVRHRQQDEPLAAIPVLVLSAAPEEGLLEAKELGADAFLSKPFDVEVMGALVRSHTPTHSPDAP